MAEEPVVLQVDDVHRMAGRIEVRHAHDDQNQRYGEDGPLDACRVLDHSEDGAEESGGDGEHEEEVSPDQVRADRCFRASGSHRVDQKDCGDGHHNAQQYVKNLFHDGL